MEYALYMASAVGAAALFLMMPRRGYNPFVIGALLGGMTLGGLWLWLGRSLPVTLGLGKAEFAYYYIFSAIAIAAAARVVTHTRPVYAALWFILVVLASAGLMLLLSAEFVAFAMVIIYAGAILVTYVFVIMLAAQSGDPDVADSSPEYERLAREPAAAAAVGFLLLAVLLGAAFAEGDSAITPNAPAPTDAELLAGVFSDRPARAIIDAVGDEAERAALREALPQTHTLENAQRVGLDLFRSHPLGLELAGVILLVALIGAVVIARQRVEGEDAAPPM